jgi:gluconate 2-dehydrogenase gamma chain
MNRREVLRLLGGVAVAPMLAPVSPDRFWDPGRTIHSRLAGWTARSLDPHQQATVAHIAELILPETDTPGAASVKVPEFIDLMLTEWSPAAERDRFLTGLADIDARSRRFHGGVFLDLRAPDQTAMLQALDGVKGAEGSAEDAFATLKDLTVYGYFTSEIVMKDVTHHEVIPGRFDGCIPF